jgi:hypothetical protein
VGSAPPPPEIARREAGRLSWRMPALRAVAVVALPLLLLGAAGCAARKFVPSQRMQALRKTMDPAEAANLFGDALGRSQKGSGLCKAGFSFDDPKPTVTMDGFTVQGWRAGAELGRRQEKGRTVISYEKLRFAEERSFAAIRKIRVTLDAAGLCAGPVPGGQAALTLHGTGAIPMVVAVRLEALDDVLAALTVLAPQAALIEGAGL